ncbi:MAG TPA: sigma-70 family RNA polymerase sigma factor [Humisphaera sp.]
MPPDLPDPPEPPPDHLLAVQRLFVQHQPALESYVLAIVRDFALAQDVVQDAFLAVTRKAGTFDLGSNFLAWASTVARFEALMAMRRAGRAALGEEALALLAASEPAHRPPPRAEWLDRCLERLAPTARRIMHLRYEDALTPSEIARLIGWTPNAVRVAASRARADLRACLELRRRAEEDR